MEDSNINQGKLPVNYDPAQLGDRGPVLRFPEVGDDLDTITDKMKLAGDIVRKGESVAVHTGYRYTATKVAVEQMDPAERRQYEIWKNGHRLPSLDKVTNRLPLPKSSLTQQPNPNTVKLYQDRAKALDIMYKTSGHTGENVAYFQKTYKDAIPLVKAVTRVYKANRHRHPDMDWEQLSPDELAEYETLQAMTTAGDAALKAWIVKMDEACRSLEENMKYLSRRGNHIAQRLRNQYPDRDFPDIRVLSPSLRTTLVEMTWELGYKMTHIGAGFNWAAKLDQRGVGKGSDPRVKLGDKDSSASGSLLASEGTTLDSVIGVKRERADDMVLGSENSETAVNGGRLKKRKFASA
jgi:hypothetical protein